MTNLDLVTIIEHDLGPGQRKGDWLFWRCPFHADRNPSLGVKDGRYYCFACQASGDAVDWLVQYRRLPMREALAVARGEDNGRKPEPIRKVVKRVALDTALKASEPPPEDWQIAAAVWVDQCHQRLFEPEGKRALDYLHGRGLTDETIRAACLGYWPGGAVEPFGRIERGVTIPNFSRGVLWGVKLRHPHGEPKYTSLKGSRAHIYAPFGIVPGSDLILCEGEFDTLITYQRLWEIASVATLGSCSAVPGGADLAALAAAGRVVICYDSDQPGQEGAQKAAEALGSKAVIAQLPDGFKDITEAVLGGLDLYRWIEPYLTPVPADAIAWAQSVGAEVRHG
ncbi:MAG: CHC2 zinc finger domain-containing protein [Anaerolineales bacterium]